MMIDKQVTLKIAQLAKIAVEPEELDKLSAELSKILTFMDQLNTLDTEQVEPLVYMNEQHNVWRADEVHSDMSTEEALKNAPSKLNSYFTVPKILEK